MMIRAQGGEWLTETIDLKVVGLRVSYRSTYYISDCQSARVIITETIDLKVVGLRVSYRSTYYISDCQSARVIIKQQT